MYHVEVGIINAHITEFWPWSKIIPFYVLPLFVSYPLQFFFHKNMQAFGLFKSVHLIISFPCLKSFSDYRNGAWPTRQDFQDCPRCSPGLLTHCHLTCSLLTLLQDADPALNGLNIPSACLHLSQASNCSRPWPLFSYSIYFRKLISSFSASLRCMQIFCKPFKPLASFTSQECLSQGPGSQFFECKRPGG